MITASMVEILDSKIEKVWDVVTSLTDYTWRSDLSKIEILSEHSFIEYDLKGYATHFQITKKDYLTCYEFTISNSNLKGKWIGNFSKIGEKTQITFTEMIDVKNPMMKLLAKGYLKKQQASYLNDLKKRISS